MGCDMEYDMEYGLMTREMTVSIWSSSISIWDILSLCLAGGRNEVLPQVAPPKVYRRKLQLNAKR